MNKANLKPILAALKKYHFWIIAAAALLIGLVSWTWATTDLAGRYGKRKTTLKGHFDKLQNIIAQPNPPNELVMDAIERDYIKLQKTVLQAWKLLFNEQQEKNPVPSVVGDEIVPFFKYLGSTGEIPVKLRETYQYHILEHVNKLDGIVKRLKPDETGTKDTSFVAPEGPGAKPEIKMTGLVDWNEQDWNRLKSRFDWKGETPNTLQVRLAQEDLWVYEALLRVIKATNEGAQEYKTAAVRRIDALDIGPDAAAAWKASEDAVVKLKPAGDQPAGGPGAGPPAKPGTEAAGTTSNLENNRYVDDNDKPLPAGAKQPFAEFKMMPIRLLLVMDQMKIPNLLAECANSNMPINILRVRLRPGAAPSADAAPGAAPAAAPPVPGTGLLNRAPAGVGGAPRKPQATAEDDPQYMPVEFQGVIQIYSPPDVAKLGTGGAAEKPAEAPSEPTPATPPAKPAPGATPPGAPAATPAPAPKAIPATPPGVSPAAPPGVVPTAPPGVSPTAPPGVVPAPSPGTAPAKMPTPSPAVPNTAPAPAGVAPGPAPKTPQP